jgi:hypothetical protein
VVVPPSVLEVCSILLLDGAVHRHPRHALALRSFPLTFRSCCLNVALMCGSARWSVTRLIICPC